MQKHSKTPFFRFSSFPRSFWLSLLFAAVFLSGSGLWLVLTQNFFLFFPGPTMDSALAGFAGFFLSWVGVKHVIWKRESNSTPFSLEHRLHFWIPFVFGLALLAQGFGNSIFSYLIGTAGPDSSFVWGDIVILSMYPTLLVGILLLPRDTLSGKVPLRFLLDSLILIVTIAIFSWHFILGPTLLQSHGGSAFDVVYPTFDLLIISCLILLSRSVANHSLRIAIRVLSLALVVFVIADSFLAYQSVENTTSNWPLIGHVVGSLAIGLSIQAMRFLAPKGRVQETTTSEVSRSSGAQSWKVFLPYALIPAVVGLIIFLWTTKQSGPLATGTYCGVLVLLALIFMKQILSIREIHWLNQGLQTIQHMLHEKNDALEQANVRLETLATTDPLTELPNHRALVTVLDQELARSQQYQRSCSLLFFDLDHFKALNDSYGHAAGDIALREFGSLLRATLPLINTVGRWGGEEFLAILPEENTVAATIIAEKLRSAVASHSFTVGGGMHLTCSIGVATSPTHGLHQEALLQAADSAMYGAKRLGRNQVRLIDDPAVVALLATNAAVAGRDEQTLLGTVHALALLVEKRDMQTGEHGQRVGELLLHFAQSMGFSETEAQLLSLAGQLHDIGKIVVPDSILQKREPLTKQELECIYQHPQVGAEVLNSIPSLRPVAPIIRSHHEWWNGMGYPDQLMGNAIPFGSRLLAVVDAYVVMTTKRPYQEAHERQWAFDELRRSAGTQFDPAIVESFLLLMATMPGSREESLLYDLSAR